MLFQFLDTKKAHEALFAGVMRQRTSLADDPVQQEALVDMVMIAKETAKLLKDMQVEWDALTQTMEKVICMRWVQDSLANGAKGEPIRGDLAVGSPTVKSMVSLPKRGSTEYIKMMHYLGIYGRSLRKDLVRAHWPGLVEHVSELMARGKEVPGCGGRTPYQLFRVAVRQAKKDAGVETFARTTLGDDAVSEDRVPF